MPSDRLTRELEEIINATPCDLVIVGTPIDLRRVVSINKPATASGTNCKRFGNQPLKTC